MRRLLLLLIALLFLISCTSTPPVVIADSLSVRAQALGKSFGTAVVYGALFNTSEPEKAARYAEILDSQFDLIVPESEMKMKNMWVSENTIDYSKADAIADWAVAHGKKMRGHVLLWYRSLPQWLVTGYNNGTYTTTQVESMVETYITSVMTHYKTKYPGLIIAWDVVNEVIGPNDPTVGGPYGLRNPGTDWETNNEDFWLMTIGNEYAKKAFTWARAADATAKLFYNDYHNEYSNAKGTAIYNFVDGLIDAGAPVDGIGLQCHFAVEYLDMSYPGIDFSVSSFSSVIDAWMALGLDVQITEIDIGMTSGQEARQAKLYADLLSTAFSKTGVSAFVSWGFTDYVSWRSADKPLYFDTGLNPKDAYFSMLEVLKQ